MTVGKRLEGMAIDFERLRAAHRLNTRIEAVGATTVAQAVYIAATHLRAAIENPKADGFGWHNPGVTICLPGPEIKDDLHKPVFLNLKGLNPGEAITPELEEDIAARFCEAFNLQNVYAVFDTLHQGVAIFTDGDDSQLYLPKELADEVAAMSKKKQEKRLAELSSHEETFPFRGHISNPKGGKDKTYSGTFTVTMLPLTIEKGVAKAHYPLVARLDFKGYDPIHWPEEARSLFMDHLLDNIKSIIPKDDLDFLDTLPEPTITSLSPGIHKQSLALINDAAYLAGRDTTQPGNIENIQGVKDVIAQKPLILMMYLYQLWQKDKDSDGWLVINNLTAVANKLKMDTRFLKRCCAKLSERQYPHHINRGGRVGSYGYASFCDAWFDYDMGADGSNYQELYNRPIDGWYTDFIEGLPVQAIRFRPNVEYMSNLVGKGLGNIFIDDEFLAWVLGLSLMEFKLWCMSSSNKPKYTGISFDKLTNQLGLTKQVSQQGRQRVLDSVCDALDGLVVKNHIKWWKYKQPKIHSAKNDKFTWEYHFNITRHRDQHRELEANKKRNGNVE